MKEMFGWFSKKEEKTIHKVEQDSTFGLMQIVRHLQNVKQLGITQTAMNKLDILSKVLNARVQDVQSLDLKEGVKLLFSEEVIEATGNLKRALDESIQHWHTLNNETKVVQLFNFSKLASMKNDIFYYTVRNFLRIAVKAFHPERELPNQAGMNIVLDELESINSILSKINYSAEKMNQDMMKKFRNEDIMRFMDDRKKLIEGEVPLRSILIRIGKIANLKEKQKPALLEKAQQLHIEAEFIEHVLGVKMIVQTDALHQTVLIQYIRNTSPELLQLLRPSNNEEKVEGLSNTELELQEKIEEKVEGLSNTELELQEKIEEKVEGLSNTELELQEKVEKKVEIEGKVEVEASLNTELKSESNGTLIANVAAQVLVNNSIAAQEENFCQMELPLNSFAGFHEIEQPSDLSEI